MSRKQHLKDTKTQGPTCKGGRFGGDIDGEHITLKINDFLAASPELQCERCRASKLFAFLSRKA